ncbi:MAG: viperin family antiviral radical SAM protein [Candidatus Thermoplasmatota archaeon]|nr:viperin family antiviral radical SAM protein [Candidatus Thermoplasmatota archaeon]
MTTLPPAINWHFWPWCNYGCKFCFARFEDIPRADRLPKEIALTVPEMLAEAGADKITFVGGEPTLCPYLGDLLAASKDVGLTTCIVSNASGITEAFLDEWGHLIDWVGLSIDASNDEIHAEIGRGMRGDLARSRSHHLELANDAWNRCRSRGIRMKLNTVVCKPNLDDDMSELVLKLRPERWKIFEVLPVEGQNDGDVDDLLLDEGEFQSWVDRHAWIADEGIQFVPESNELMRGSYAMMDALGRFYSNSEGGHAYGPSILEIGVLEAWEQNCFFEDRFHDRGGVYEWGSGKVTLPVAGQGCDL